MIADIYERRRKIVSCLDQGQGDIGVLSSLLGVSTMTIRRDLSALEKQGKVLRVFGGAIARERLAYEFSFKEKEAKNKQAKEWIGRIGASLVKPRETVFIDTGTTALAVAMALRGRKPCTIVTINLCVASEMVGQRDIRVLTPGGLLSEHSPDLYGEWTMKNLSELQMDVAFLGCDGVDTARGFYASDIKIAAVSRLVLTQSRRSFLVADSSKFGVTSFCRIGLLTDVTGLITDTQLRGDFKQSVTELGVRMYQGTAEPAEAKTEKRKGKT